MTGYRPIFDALPRLRSTTPWIELADGLPTPVEQVDERLWVKRDDLTDSTYGGNKVRKLEFLLAEAIRHDGPVITVGATGSHQVIATAVHAKRVGKSVEAVRFPQPDNEHVREAAAQAEATGVLTDVWCPSPNLMPFWTMAHSARRQPDDPFTIGPGGSSSRGTLGYVNAALEIARQYEAAGRPPPDEVVVASSSGGTVVGLDIGLRLAGWRATTVVGVRVADAIVTNHLYFGRLSLATAWRVWRAGGPRPGRHRFEIDTGYFGGGYGVETDVAARAADEAALHGLELDPTYTAKAYASALDRARRGRTVLFVHTLSAAHVPTENT